MSRARKIAFVLGVMIFGAGLCAAQLLQQPTDPARAAALDKAADDFVQRLHQSLDFNGVSGMFVTNFAALHRDYPGDFMPFDTPRVSKALLKQLDDATLSRKLLADWNLHYWMSLFMMSSPEGTKPEKAMPADFVKGAKKSKYLKFMIGVPGQVTLAAPEEMTEYLTEADQLGAMLKKSVRPEMASSEGFRSVSEKARATFGAPRLQPDAMGQEAAYTVARDAMMLVMVEKDGQYRLITLAPLGR